MPALNRNEITFERQTKHVQVEDRRGGSAEREVTVFIFEITYDGEDYIFNIRPTQWDSAPPYGKASHGLLKITVENESDPQRIKQLVNETLNSIDKYLGWHRVMWAPLSQNIESAVRQRLAQRRQKLSQAQSAETGLEAFGFKPKS